MKGMVTNMWAYESVFIRSIPWDSAEFLLKMTDYRDMRSNVWRTGSPYAEAGSERAYISPPVFESDTHGLQYQRLS